MVRIDNIRKIRGIVLCDYYPEDGKDKGSLVISIRTGEIVKSKSVICDKGSYAGHARDAALNAIEKNPIPKEAFAYWY